MFHVISRSAEITDALVSKHDSVHEYDTNYVDLHLKDQENVKVRTFTYDRSFKIRGLCANKDFEVGQPVMLYAGQILTEEEKCAARREYRKAGCKNNYMMELVSDHKKSFYIDCTRRGNLAGLANCRHGKNNLTSEAVRNSCYASHELYPFPQIVYNGRWEIALVAKTRIRKDDELSLDYKNDYCLNNGKFSDCFCGDKACTFALGMKAADVDAKVMEFRRLPKRAVAQSIARLKKRRKDRKSPHYVPGKNDETDLSEFSSDTNSDDEPEADAEPEQVVAEAAPVSPEAANPVTEDNGIDKPVSDGFAKLVEKWESDFTATHADSFVNQYGKRIASIGPDQRKIGRRLCWEYALCSLHMEMQEWVSCFNCDYTTNVRAKLIRHWHNCMREASHYFHSIHPVFQNKKMAELNQEYQKSR
jgi:hypothetical protein